MNTLIPGIASSSAGLAAERLRMEVVSQNIANAHTTRGVDGKPYQRQQVVFETMLSNHQNALGGRQEFGLPSVRIEQDDRPYRQIYNPGHPDANPQTGMVAMPDVKVHAEMADLIVASRAYEANLAAVNNARSLALQTLAIGKGK